MIPLYKSYHDQADIEAVNDVIRRGTYWAEGPEIADFEHALAEYLHVKYVLVCNSGTSALHLAMLSWGIGHGDEVIIPSFTFIATANAVRFVGATPVFADIETDTYGLDAGDVMRRITTRTVAIMPVHYAGQQCQIEKLKKVADDYKLLLIEDMAEGLFPLTGDCGILSFCANKIISTGEGGALITNNQEIYNSARLFRSHGRATSFNFRSFEADSYVLPGYNFRMSSMTAALGLSQLFKIDKILSMRRQVAQWYGERLGKSLIPNHQYQLYTIKVFNQIKVQKRLAENGIMSRVYFYPVHKSPCYRSSLTLPVTERVSSEVLSLPIYPGLTESEVDFVCQKLT